LAETNLVGALKKGEEVGTQERMLVKGWEPMHQEVVILVQAVVVASAAEGGNLR
jgi:hypothetical protein